MDNSPAAKKLIHKKPFRSILCAAQVYDLMGHAQCYLCARPPQLFYVTSNWKLPVCHSCVQLHDGFGSSR